MTSKEKLFIENNFMKERASKMLSKIDSLSYEKSEIQSLNLDLNNRLAEFEEKISNLESNNSNLVLSIDEKNLEEKKYNTQLQDNIKEINKRDLEIKNLISKLSNLNDQKESLKEEILIKNSEIRENRKNINIISRLEQKNEKLKEEIFEQKDRYKKQAHEYTILSNNTVSKENFSEIRIDLSKASSALKKSENIEVSLKEKNIFLYEEIATYKKEITSLKNDNKSIIKKFESLEIKLNGFKEANDELKNKIKNYSLEIRSLNSDNTKMAKKLEKAENKPASKSSQKDNNEKKLLLEKNNKLSYKISLLENEINTINDKDSHLKHGKATKKEITSLENLIQKSNSENKELSKKISELESSNSNKDKVILSLNNNISKIDNKIIEMQQSKSSIDSNKENEVNDIESRDKTEFEKSIDSKDKIILSLNNRISRMNAELDSALNIKEGDSSNDSSELLKLSNENKSLKKEIESRGKIIISLNNRISNFKEEKEKLVNKSKKDRNSLNDKSGDKNLRKRELLIAKMTDKLNSSISKINNLESQLELENAFSMLAKDENKKLDISGLINIADNKNEISIEDIKEWAKGKK